MPHRGPMPNYPPSEYWKEHYSEDNTPLGIFTGACLMVIAIELMVMMVMMVKAFEALT